MTDKELLALAAKAVGGLLYVADMDAWIEYDEATGARGNWWNPLTDDGDALRLAVDLRMDIMASKFHDDASAKDAHEQMRRSIVRVAAETGKAAP